MTCPSHTSLLLFKFLVKYFFVLLCLNILPRSGIGIWTSSTNIPERRSCWTRTHQENGGWRTNNQGTRGNQKSNRSSDPVNQKWHRMNLWVTTNNYKKTGREMVQFNIRGIARLPPSCGSYISNWGPRHES